MQEIEERPPRKLFRAIHGLAVKVKHWHYCLPDGRYLWRDKHGPGLVARSCP